MTDPRLTATRLAAMRRCPRQHWLRYEVGLSRIRQATPLRFGAAFHRGMALHNAGLSPDQAIQSVTEGYQKCPDWADPTNWAVERETVAQLLAGHFWRYENDDVEVLAAELPFEIPLVNPDTGARSRTFRLAGKIDGIARLPDARLALLEYKTAGEDISPDGDYWLRLRCDGQITLYVLAARALGYDVATTVYDVTRKPTIRLRKGETPEEYGQRLLADIGDRPDCHTEGMEPLLPEQSGARAAARWRHACVVAGRP